LYHHYYTITLTHCAFIKYYYFKFFVIIFPFSYKLGSNYFPPLFYFSYLCNVMHCYVILLRKLPKILKKLAYRQVCSSVQLPSRDWRIFQRFSTSWPWSTGQRRTFCVWLQCGGNRPRVLEPTSDCRPCLQSARKMNNIDLWNITKHFWHNRQAILAWNGVKLSKILMGTGYIIFWK